MKPDLVDRLAQEIADHDDVDLLDEITLEAGGKRNIAKVVGKLIRDAADSMERGERLDKETRENLNKFITLIVKREQDKETENLNLLSDEELRGRLKDALKTSLQEELGQQARRFEAHLQRLRDLKTALFSSWDERSDPATMRRCRRELDAALEVTHASL